MFSQKVLIRLKNAYNVTVLTGAGLSAESGVPTFRGKDGLWNDHKVEELATIGALKDNPQAFWDFYHYRRKMLKEVKPNFGHFALVDFENYFADLNLITQNVDDLHNQAGSKNLIELHGNITRNRCTNCADVTIADSSVTTGIPKCSKCGYLLKPDIVLYGEELDKKSLSKAQEGSAVCEVFFSVGTSSLVEPAASIPYIAKGNGAYLVEINTEETSLTKDADEVVNIPAAKALTALVMILDRIK